MSAERITFDVAALEDDLKGLGQRGVFALTTSINRGAIAGKTAMVKAIGADMKMQQKYVSKAITIDKAEKTKPVTTLFINASRIPLIAFGARGPEPSRGKGRGVSYRLPSGRERIPEGFIASVEARKKSERGADFIGPVLGHRGVFKRRGALGRKVQGPRGFIGRGGVLRPGAGRLPIVELLGPSVGHIFLKKIDLFRSVASESVLKNLAHEIIWRKGGGGAAA